MTLPPISPLQWNVALRLTLASITAMAVATALGLPNPWWAAMAVWMIGQPPRGLLLERCLAQLLGTIAGAAVGAMLVALVPEMFALAGLALWLGVCCGVANAMRHQRSYGAAVCGLTSAVIVCLTLGTGVDPVGFASARVLDNLIGVASALAMAVLLGRPTASQTFEERVQEVTSQGFELIAEALEGQDGRSLMKERAFLVSLASAEAALEDAAAGSVRRRRKLREAHVVFASFLDLVVVARAIRFQQDERAAESAQLRELIDAFRTAGSPRGLLQLDSVFASARRLEQTDIVLYPVIEEMTNLLLRVGEGHRNMFEPAPQAVARKSLPHPDVAALNRSLVRGILAVAVVSLAWFLAGWDALRYLTLATCIFTVLFSAVDEPAPLVRQVLAGGFLAALAAFCWRVGILPVVGSGWVSLVLTVPLVLGASLLQARTGSVFFGLAFNMLFAVLARPVDVLPSSPVELAGAEAMLLAGIAVSYAFYRWLLPMNTPRRRVHLRASIRKEIAAIALRAGTPWAERHLARLRFLVFSLAIRARGDVADVEDALAALSLGHVLVRLGEAAAPSSEINSQRDAILEVLRLVASPMDNPKQVAAVLHRRAQQMGQGTAAAPDTSRLRWLFELAAHDLTEHAPMFSQDADAGNRLMRLR